MLRKDSALTQAGPIREVVVSILCALTLTFAASHANADESYSRSNHLTAKEQKKMGRECVDVFNEVPPFGPRTPDEEAALDDAQTRQELLTCMLRLVALRTTGEATIVDRHFPREVAHPDPN
jgi:hypothetical protein